MADRGLIERTHRAVQAWGATDGERTEPLACDVAVPDARLHVVRAVDVAAPAAVTFRWLCQLRAAPYSYDSLDNLGRRSPQELVPGLDVLEHGQRFMTIFRLHAFVPGQEVTLVHRGAFGRVGATYRATPRGPAASRLLLRISWRTPALPFGRGALEQALAAGDLVMARRQLLNLKALAERSARAAPTAASTSA